MSESAGQAQAAIMLSESILHLLVEEKLLTREAVVMCLEGICELKRDIIEDEDSKEVSLRLLDGICRTFAAK